MGSYNDPISDLLTRIRNAGKAKNRYFDIGHSKIKENIVRILKDKGFISHFLIKTENNKSTMRVFLKYSATREPAIQGLKRMSKPSLRQYVSYTKMPHVLRGMGISIVSTSHGVMEGRQAREKKVGGELLCLVW
jgi:small subunit ribosomal protein S8